MRDAIMAFALQQIASDVDLMHLWNERAGIRQFDGGMEKEEAEWFAMLDVLAML